MKESLADLASDTLQELTTLRDELQLKVHLGGKDAQDAWQDLRPHLDRVEHLLREMLEQVRHLDGKVEGEAALQLHLAWMNARDRWNEMEPVLDRIVEKIRSRGLSARGMLDHGLVQARLGRMEAESLVQARKAELRRAWNEVQQRASTSMRHLGGSMHRLREGIASVP